MSKRRTWDVVLATVAGVFFLGLVARFHAWILFSNIDVEKYFGPWFDHIITVGRRRSIEGSFCNYTPPYVYVLTGSSLLYPYLSKVACIKLVNLPFIPLAGWAAWHICRLLGADRLRAKCGSIVLMFLPEVSVNAWHWGQCDIMFTTCLLWMTVFLLQGRSKWALPAFGVALAFKLQAIFAAPVLLGLLFAGDIPWLATLLVVPAYVSMMLPAALAGRQWFDLLTIYARLADLFNDLTMGMPNIYVPVLLLTQAHTEVLVRLGTAFAGIGAGLLALLVVRHASLRRREGLILSLASSLVFLPYILPKMHERYFFAGNCFLVLLGVVKPKVMVAAAVLQVAALMAYSFFMHGHIATAHELMPAFVVATIGVVLVGWCVREQSRVPVLA